MRSQSLPLELSSFSMRSAKFGQGTNSNFIAMPVLAVKSFESSTRALAGSHAAQQSVSCLFCAWAEDANASIAVATRAPARATSGFISSPLCGWSRKRCLAFARLLNIARAFARIFHAAAQREPGLGAGGVFFCKNLL